MDDRVERLRAIRMRWAEVRTQPELARADVAWLLTELEAARADAAQLREALLDVRGQFFSDPPFVGWRKRMLEDVDAALAGTVAPPDAQREEGT